MSHPTPTAGAPGYGGSGFAAAQRLLVAVLIASLFAICLGVMFVSPDPFGLLPPAWVPPVQVAAGVVVALLIRVATGAVQPLDPGLPDHDAARVAQQRYQAATSMRFVLAESIAIISLGIGFALTDEAYFLTFVGGAVVSLVLMVMFVWPSRRTVSAIAERLESQGQPSGLQETFGHGTPGAIQEL